MATFFDITKRKNAEERLLLTQFAIDKFTDSSIWIKPDGQINYVNEATCKNLGYSRDELLSMKIWTSIRDTRMSGSQKGGRRLKKNKGLVKFESVRIRKDGSSFPVEISGNYLRYIDKEYVVTFERDITVRKQREIELSDAKAQAEIYLDLIGHDINNMNQVAIGYLELADDVIKSGRELGENNIELIEKPITSLNNSSNLIDKVMKLKKLKAGELRVGRVDICSLLTRIKDRYSHLAGRDITINYIPLSECTVMANELIDEIFINLVENSIKHSPAGINYWSLTYCRPRFARMAKNIHGFR